MNTIITQNELNRLTLQELGELHQLLTLLLAEWTCHGLMPLL